MTTHSSILAWEIPWAKESGRLQFIESQRVRHDLAAEQQQQLHTHYFIKQISVQLLFFLIYWTVKVEFKGQSGKQRAKDSISVEPPCFLRLSSLQQGVITPTSHECWI